eukprot:sb/3473982/
MSQNKCVWRARGAEFFSACYAQKYTISMRELILRGTGTGDWSGRFIGAPVIRCLSLELQIFNANKYWRHSHLVRSPHICVWGSQQVPMSPIVNMPRDAKKNTYINLRQKKTICMPKYHFFNKIQSKNYVRNYVKMFRTYVMTC